ncbi:MAG: tetrahydromethanopterin S-methyltransferase subunit D [Methanosarcinales archaeon]|nr:MAG: tetrahydromethanopterin S-methyltransferase subunit D [Methanosarcinales archaeon]
MDPITGMIGIIVGGIIVGICVHFIPASAVGAMSASTGIATGPSMLSTGCGLAGLYAAGYMIGESLPIVVLSGAMGSALMIICTMLLANTICAFGTGVAPVAGSYAKDPITGWRQKPFMSPGTDGHSMPTTTALSGIIGALLGGAGGSLVFVSVYEMISPTLESTTAVTIAGMVGAGVFLINCVIPAYVLVGKSEGMTDKKMKLMHKTFVSCLIVSVITAVFVYASVVVM